MRGDHVEVAALVGHPGDHGERLGLGADVVGLARQRQPALGVGQGVVEQARQPGRPRRHGEQVEVAGNLVEAQLRELQRLVGRSERQRLAGAQPRFGHHVVEAARALGMVGQRHVVAALRLAQRGQRRLVQAAPLAAEQPGLDRLAGQLVVEPEQVGVALDQQPPVDRDAQASDQVGLGRAGHRRKEVERHAAAEHRCGPHHGAHVGVEVVELGAHQLGHRPRQRRVVVARGHLPRRRHQLLEEERVPAGAHVEGVDGAERRLLVEHGRQEAADLRGGEAVEVDVRDPVPPVEAGHGVGGRVAAGQAVGPVGPHQHQAPTRPRRARRRGLGQALEHGDALGVGPVEVLEHEERGAATGPVAQRPHQVDPGPDALLRGAVGVAHGGHEGREVGAAVVGHRGVARGHVDRVEEQLHRPSDGARVGLAGEDERPGGRPPHQLLDEPGLADAGLAGHQRHGRFGARADEGGQAVELDRPAHHHG